MNQIDTYPKIYLYRRIVQAKLFIDTRYSENINLEKIANEAFFSKFHFIRLFKKIYGTTPHQYLKIVRIENAMQLLRTGISVTDVCFSVGFESVSSFSGLFKQIVGMSPFAYVRQQQLLKEQIQKTPLNFIPGCFVNPIG